ncbi:MAG: hypothetical protein IPF59_12985 [Ignavibacteria bacterium]|nr:hypothetical protein [Ignavibacteria bacterium]
MKKWFVLALLSLCSLLSVRAQVTISATQGFGPFPQGQTRSNTFSISGLQPGVGLDSVMFQVTAGTGTSTQTLAYQRSAANSFVVDMAILPWQPTPQITAVAFLRNQYSKYSTTISKQIQISAPIINLTSTDNFGPVIVGRPHSATFTASSLPAGTTRVTLTVTDQGGQIIAQADTSGASLTSARLNFSSTLYPGQLRVNALVRYPTEPTNGYVLQKIITDSLIRPTVLASQGFGPFKPAVHLTNTFIVQGLGPGCTTLQWIIQYKTPTGYIRQPVSITRAYDAVKDSMHFVYDMRNVSPNSTLRVLAKYGAGQFLTAESDYSLTVPTSVKPPRFRINDSIPLRYGISKVDTIMLDSLPSRITKAILTLTDIYGHSIATKTFDAPTGTYIDSTWIVFNVNQLPPSTAILRAEFQNDMSDDNAEYDYEIEVRDTSKAFLFADSWGPFVQSDSATITPGVTYLKPISGPPPTAVFGRFSVVDTTDPTVAIVRSPLLLMTGITNADTMLYWPDSSYVLGSTSYGRALIRTDVLPLTSIVLFERLVVRGSDTTVESSVSHPIIMLPSPGTLSSNKGYGPFVVTRPTPVTFTMSNLPMNASKVRFAVSGTSDITPVDQSEVTVPAGTTSVEWTTDVGNLPVNAQLWVWVVTPTSSDNGTLLRRALNTIPDTLSVQFTARIDTIGLDWSVQQNTNVITGPKSYSTMMTFSKIPAQTKTIQVLSVNEQSGVTDTTSVQIPSTIDSTTTGLPYRLGYDPGLSVQVPFSFRAFNTQSIQVRYLSDGGPRDGVRYTRPVVMKMPNLSFTAKKMDVTKRPPAVDPTPIRQGSTDIVDLDVRWAPNGTASLNTGLASGLKIDSVIFRARDCSGRVVDQGHVTPSPALVMNGVAADSSYVVTKLPLSVASVELQLYSKSLTFPNEGVLVSTPLTVIPFPQFNAPYGFSYPTFRVLDSTTASLPQRFYLTNVDGIQEIDSTRFVDKNGVTRYVFAMQIPSNDTIHYPTFDVNTLDANLAPYTIVGKVRSDLCNVQRSYTQTLATFDMPRVLADPPQRNWVYSSLGWGPFRQGRAPTTVFRANFDPAQFITTRSEIGDSLRVSIAGINKDGPFQDATPAVYSFPNATALPTHVNAGASVNLNPYDTSSSIALHVVWIRKSSAGVTTALDKFYPFPITMIEFPDQPIVMNKTEFEQSVLAGSSSTPVMQDSLKFSMKAASIAIDSLTFAYYNSVGVKLDTFRVTPTNINTVDTTSIFAYARDVAQFKWPDIARNQGHVSVRIGYVFQTATRPTKMQYTAFDIEPHAEWLNGSVATLNGTATQTTVPIKVVIPMPSSTFGVIIPLFNEIVFGIPLDESNRPLNVTVDALYNRTTKGFSFAGPVDEQNCHWPPTITLFGGVNFSYNVTADDGTKSGEFEAIRAFEESDGIPLRELRVRALYSSSFSANGVGMVSFINEMAKVIGDIIGDAEDEETGGVVELKPIFSLGGGTQQISVVNLATNESGALQNTSTVPSVRDPEAANLMPSSQAVGINVSGGGGLELSFIKGLAGISASISVNDLIATGEVYSGIVNNVTRQYYVPTLNPSVWFTLELSLLWGLIKLDLFKGRLYSWTSPYTMPSFPIYSESWESIFKPRFKQESGDRPQVSEPIAELPAETPYYRPSPALAANDSALVAVWVEHAELDNSGTLVIGALDRSAHQFSRTGTIARNRNGIHDPSVTLVGTNGDALVTWTQNDRNAGDVENGESVGTLLRSENVHVAFFDAAVGGVTNTFKVADASGNRMDGNVQIAVAPDGTNAMAVWASMEPSASSTDITGARLFRVNGKWEMGDPRTIATTSGLDRDLSIGVLADGTYLISWINENGQNGSSDARFVSSTETAWSTPVVVASSNGSMAITDIDMSVAGNRAIMLVAKHDIKDTTEVERVLSSYVYEAGSWSQPTDVDLGDGKGYIRHLDVSINAEGELFAALDLYDRTSPSTGQRSFITLSGSSPSAPSSWKRERDNPVVVDRNNASWHMRSTIGPDNTYYTLGQELDTIAGNVQVYRNGIQVGPQRLNMVLRAVRQNANGDLVERRFGGQPTSVDDGEAERVERDLRYRPYLLDPAPNPAHEASLIPVAVQVPSHITIVLKDAVGRTVSTLFDGQLDKGIHGMTVTVDTLSSGTYFVVMTDQTGMISSVPLTVVQ